MTQFPFGLHSPPEHDGPLPDAVDVAIIGGGIIGICAALWLARRGQRVVVLEKGRVAAEQSSRNWGWIRTQGRDAAEIPISMESRQLWRGLEAQCNGRLGLRAAGVSYLARDDRAMAGYADWLALARGHDGLDSRLLDREGVRALLPGATGDWVGALHTPSDLVAEPWVAVPDIARLAVAEGVAIREGCAVRGLDIAAGRVTGVVTEAGRLRAGAVVLAGGAWSSLFLRRHGVALPQLSVRATVLATDTLPEVTGGAAAETTVAWRRRADGGYSLAPSTASSFSIGPDSFRALRAYLPLLRAGGFDVAFQGLTPRGYPDGWRTARRWRDDETSPFEAMRVLNPAPDPRAVAAILARFATLFPEAGAVRAHRIWAGMIDTLPDVVPVVDHCAALPGLVVATGMCGHGFGIGPAFGRIIADMVTGGAIGHDMTRFRMARFSDGSRMQPGPNI